MSARRRLVAGTAALAVALLVACDDKAAPSGLPPAGAWQGAPGGSAAAPAKAAAVDPSVVETIAACVAASVVHDAAQLRTDQPVTDAIEAYAEAPPELRRIGLAALAREAQARLTGGRALAKLAASMADAGAGTEAAALATAAYDQAAADSSSFAIGRTTAMADAARALARAGAHEQLSARPSTEPEVLAATAIGHAQAGAIAVAEQALTAADTAARAGERNDLGAALARIEAAVWLGQVDRARSVVTSLAPRNRVLGALMLARAAIEAGRADAPAQVAYARELHLAPTPAPSAPDERARARADHLASAVAIARLRLRGGDRAGALADLDALSASITEATPGLYEAGALAEAARVAATAADDTRAQALIARASGSSLGDVHAAPAASIDRLTRRGEHRAALEVVHNHAGVTSTFFATIFARAAAGPLDRALGALLQQRACRTP